MESNGFPPCLRTKLPAYWAHRVSRPRDDLTHAVQHRTFLLVPRRGAGAVLHEPARLPQIYLAGNQQNIFAEGARARVEQHQHHGEEQEEMCGVEQHGSDHLAAGSPGGPNMRATSSASMAENRSIPSRFRWTASLKNSGCSRQSKRCSFARITLGRDANSRMELLRFFAR